MAEPKALKLTTPPTNTEAECDSVLGAYLRAWDQIEANFLPLFTKMFGAHQNATLALLRVGLNQPTLRTILESLASIRLQKAMQKELIALLRRWETASSKRNRIVHGHWMLSIEMIPGPSGKLDHTKSAWIRFYNPSDSTLLDKIFAKPKDQKLVATHQFRLKDIQQFTQDLHKLARDMRAFVEQMAVLPFVNYQPIDLEQ